MFSCYCLYNFKRVDSTGSYRLSSLNSDHRHGKDSLIHLWNFSIVSSTYLLREHRWSFISLNFDTPCSNLDVAGSVDVVILVSLSDSC